MIDLANAAVARLVPLLFAASAILVIGRFAHDRYLPAGRAIARSLFGAVGLIGVLLVTPYLVASWAVLAGQQAYLTDRWQQADRWFADYRGLGRAPSPTIAREWAVALMNLGRWSEAEGALLAAVERHDRRARVAPYDVYLLGLCRYYEQRWDAAQRSLAAVSTEPMAVLAPYYLGRLAERRGELARAAALYRESLRRAPQFLPAAYQLARVDRAVGVDPTTDVEPRLPAARQTPLAQVIRSSLRSGAALPPVEFPFPAGDP